MQQERLTPAEEELEAALRSLRPAAAAIERDRLMFQAGRATVRRSGRAWLGAVAVLAAALGASLLHRPQPRIVERIVRVQTPATPTVAGAAFASAGQTDWTGQGRYLRLRERLLAEGLDALPAPAEVATPERPERLEDLLGLPRGSSPGPRIPSIKELFIGGSS